MKEGRHLFIEITGVAIATLGVMVPLHIHLSNRIDAHMESSAQRFDKVAERIDKTQEIIMQMLKERNQA